MTTHATERLRRLLAVFPLFADCDEVSLDQLERSSGVDAPTLIEDLAAITDREDEPGGFVSSVRATIEHSRVSINSDHFLRPLRLNAAELSAIELGLAMLAATSPPDDRRAIAGARARVRKAIAKLPASESADEGWEGVAPSLADEHVVSVIREGLRDRRKVRLSYLKGSGEESRARVVRGYGLVSANDTWYLIAHCELTDGLRFFRLDRVEDVALLGDKYRVPPTLSVERLLASGKPFFSGATQTLTVRYSSRIARWIAEREKLPLAEDGTLTVEHPLADEDWAVRHVLQYGPEAEVLSPSEIRERIRSRLTEILA